MISAEPQIESSRWCWTRDEYYRASDLGLFGEQRVELLDGEVWLMPPQKTPHYSAIEATAEALEIAFGNGFTMRRQGPLTLTNGSEPEPDLIVVPGSWRDYVGHHPIPQEVCLLVEMSDATLLTDRTRKSVSYAAAGILEYWIVNLVNRQLEVFRDPATAESGSFYKTTLILLEDDSVSPLHAPNSTITVSDLLPPRLNDALKD